MRRALIRAAARVCPQSWRYAVGSNVYRFENWLRHGDPHRFWRISVETTSACNRRCPYCPNSTYDRGLIENEVRMDRALYGKILAELAEMDFRGRFSPHMYGEPLLDPRLPELIAETRKQLPQCSIVLFTNGDKLDVTSYLELAQAGADWFIITQHGPAMPPGVREVLDYREQKGGGKVMIDYAVINDETPLYNRGGLVDHPTVFKMKTCNVASDELTVDCHGNVLLCCNDYLGTAPFGNIKEERIQDIWAKPEFKKIRRELRRGVFTIEMCRKCARGE